LANIADTCSLYDLGGNVYGVFSTGVINPTGALTAPSLVKARKRYARQDWEAFANNDTGYRVLQSGDTQPRFAVRGDGLLSWGAGGSSATDSLFGRQGADRVGTSAGDSLHTGA